MTENKTDNYDCDNCKHKGTCKIINKMEENKEIRCLIITEPTIDWLNCNFRRGTNCINQFINEKGMFGKPVTCKRHECKAVYGV
jgi:hypothetical protein